MRDPFPAPPPLRLGAKPVAKPAADPRDQELRDLASQVEALERQLLYWHTRAMAFDGDQARLTQLAADWRKRAEAAEGRLAVIDRRTEVEEALARKRAAELTVLRKPASVYRPELGGIGIGVAGPIDPIRGIPYPYNGPPEGCRSALSNVLTQNLRCCDPTLSGHAADCPHGHKHSIYG